MFHYLTKSFFTDFWKIVIMKRLNCNNGIIGCWAWGYFLLVFLECLYHCGI